MQARPGSPITSEDLMIALELSKEEFDACWTNTDWGFVAMEFGATGYLYTEKQMKEMYGLADEIWDQLNLNEWVLKGRIYKFKSPDSQSDDT